MNALIQSCDFIIKAGNVVKEKNNLQIYWPIETPTMLDYSIRDKYVYEKDLYQRLLTIRDGILYTSLFGFMEIKNAY